MKALYPIALLGMLALTACGHRGNTDVYIKDYYYVTEGSASQNQSLQTTESYIHYAPQTTEQTKKKKK